MPIGKDFSREKWKEIDEARTRLEAYRNKVQPYPALPVEEIPIAGIANNGLSSNRVDTLLQLRNEVRGWRRKHTEMMLKMDKMEKQPKEQPF